jgi:transglutaminase-like putative cysteine protease
VIATLAALLASGNVFTLPTDVAAFPFYTTLAQNFHTTYTGGIIVQTIGMVLLIHRTTRPSEAVPTSKRLKIALTLNFLAAGLLAVLFCFLLIEFEPVISRFYSQYLSGLQRNRSRTVLFSREVNLYRTLPGLKGQDQTVLLRATGRQAPGYLRGRVYDLYDAGRWTTSSRPAAGLSQEAATGMRAYTIYSRPMPRSAEDKEIVFDVFPEVRIESEALFLPGRAFRFELVAEELSQDIAGQVTQTEWEQGSGYRVYADPAIDESYPLPETPASFPAEWLYVPPELDTGLEDILKANPPPTEPEQTWNKLPAADIIRGMETMLQSLCTYSLDSGISSSGPDPVLQFLTDKQKGHCELFAASAVMLLRKIGIPARYVTGLICAEQTPGGYWIARMQNAHAWAEAWDPQVGQWRMVEATPPIGIPEGSPRIGSARKWLDMPAFLFRWVIAKLKRGEVAEIIIQALVSIWRILVWIAVTPLAWPFAILFLWWLRKRTGIGRDLFQRHKRADAEVVRLRKALEKALAKNGIRRAAEETPMELAERIEKTQPPGPAAAWRALLEDYAALRYNPRARSPERIQSLIAALRAKA